MSLRPVKSYGPWNVSLGNDYGHANLWYDSLWADVIWYDQQTVDHKVEYHSSGTTEIQAIYSRQQTWR